MIELSKELLIYVSLEVLFVIVLTILIIKRFRYVLKSSIQMEFMTPSTASKESFKLWLKVLIFILLAGAEIGAEALLGPGIAIAWPLSLLVIFATAIWIFFDELIYYGGSFWGWWHNFITSFFFPKVGPATGSCTIKVRKSNTSFPKKHIMDMYFTATAKTNPGCTVEFMGTRDVPPNVIKDIKTWISPEGGYSQTVYVEGKAYICKRDVASGNCVAISLDFTCKCPNGNVGNKLVTLLWRASYMK